MVCNILSSPDHSGEQHLSNTDIYKQAIIWGCVPEFIIIYFHKFKTGN